MSQVEIEGADLKSLVERARGGEDVTLAQGGRAIARIVLVPDTAEVLPKRRLGLARGKWTVPDDFDAPLSEEELALFYDSPIFPDGPPPAR